MTPPVKPVLFTFGDSSFGLHWYGLLILTGIVLGANLAAYLAKRNGEDPDTIWDMLIVAVILAIIGARVYHVFSSPSNGLLGWDYYKQYPLEAFYIWKGGLGIYGAIAGGALGVLIYCWVRKLSPLRWLDFAAPGMAIGQSIGRWGNYVNMELYGPPTTLPWGLNIPLEHRLPVYSNPFTYPVDEVFFHPTFLYESLATLALCLLLLWIAIRFEKQRRPGDLLLGYLVGYAIIRFFIELLRPDAWMAGSLATAQVIALLLAGSGVLLLVGRRLIKRAPAQG